MNILDILNEAVEQNGSVLIAGIIGSDGMGVEMVMNGEELPHDHLIAELELAAFTNAAATIADRLGVGHVYDLVMETDEMTYLISYVITGYYAVVGIMPEADMVRAKHTIWQLIDRVNMEL